MKKMNFWKTLLGSVMVLAAFTACSTTTRKPEVTRVFPR